MTKRNDLFTTMEAAAYLRLSHCTLERYRVTGKGPTFLKLGRKVFYQRAELDTWIRHSALDIGSRAGEDRSARDIRCPSEGQERAFALACAFEEDGLKCKARSRRRRTALRGTAVGGHRARAVIDCYGRIAASRARPGANAGAAGDPSGESASPQSHRSPLEASTRVFALACRPGTW